MPRHLSFDVVVPPDVTFIADTSGSQPAISPDGSRIAFNVAVGIDDWYIALRDLDDADTHVLATTRHGVRPTFSPDGQSIAYREYDTLRRLSVRGGDPLRICDDLGRSDDAQFAWIEGDTVVMSVNYGQRIIAIPAEGGEPRDVVAIRDKEDHGAWGFERIARVPGRSDVVLAGAWNGSTIEDYGVYAVHLADGRVELVLDRAADPHLIQADTLIFLRGSTLLAVGFDADALRPLGEPVLALEGVRSEMWAGTADWDVSANGTLAYVPGGRRLSDRSPVRIDADGERTPVLTEHGRNAFEVAIAPDGRHVAVTTLRNEMQLWVADLERGTWTSVARDDEYYGATWSPDGAFIAAQVLSPMQHLMVFPAMGGPGREIPLTRAGDVDLTAREAERIPQAWLRDGRIILTTPS